jgi:CRP-like cAMP-binding protein
MDPRSLIDHASLFREMPEAVRAALATAATIRRYRAGEYIWRTGESGDSLQIVSGGLVLVGAEGPDGEEILLHIVGPGDCMGEPSIYADTHERQTNARAVAATTLLIIPGLRVRPILEGTPEAMRAFVRRVSEICRGHARRVGSGAFHDARGRLGRVILDLAASHGSDTPAGRRIDLPISQRTLAGLVGLRRESVNRLIAELESAGALRIDRGVITVLVPSILRGPRDVDGWMT